MAGSSSFHAYGAGRLVANIVVATATWLSDNLLILSVATKSTSSKCRCIQTIRLAQKAAASTN
jgi:hypothetical protein